VGGGGNIGGMVRPERKRGKVEKGRKAREDTKRVAKRRGGVMKGSLRVENWGKVGAVIDVFSGKLTGKRDFL